MGIQIAPSVVLRVCALPLPLLPNPHRLHRTETVHAEFTMSRDAGSPAKMAREEGGIE